MRDNFRRVGKIPYTTFKHLGLTGSKLSYITKKICGDKIGSGMYRDTFVFKENSNWVVKIERDMSEANFINVTEWINYINNEDWDLVGQWLAPCIAINETGQVLIQQRIYWNGKIKKDYPQKVPIVFTDLKRENFGWTKKGKFVCCDYSFLVTPMTNKKMRTAKWRGELPG